MQYQLEVFDSSSKRIGSMAIIIGRSAVPTAEDPFLWQWQGKGGAAFGTWEWRQGGGDWRILFSKMLSGDLWGTLYGPWETLPTPQPFPRQPWFSHKKEKEGDISINTTLSYYNASWKLK